MAPPFALLGAFFLVVTSSWVSYVVAATTPFLDQSFFFDYTNSTQPFSIPVTKQCETIHVEWQRSTATGPNPVSPYFLQVYTTGYIIPFIIPAGDQLSFDWQVPFAPGQLYQICMFDKNGNTGGCQDTYTMIPADSTPSCSNITFNPILDVTANVENGPMSQYGWIEQCTDISVKPNNGTPPFTLTVAPALHPPYNITQNSMDAINWTVSLSWGSPFFISLVDSTGAMWSNGLLHSAQGETSECLLDNGGVAKDPTTVKPAVAIGSGIGGLVVGLLAGLASAFFIGKYQQKRRLKNDYISNSPMSSGVVGTFLNRHNGSASELAVEPFLSHPDQGTSYGGSTSTPDTSLGSSQGTRKNGSNHVYVMHHDSGRAPVTVYHEDGTQVVELPPRYPAGFSPPSSSGLLSGVSTPGEDDNVRHSRMDSEREPAFLLQPRRPDRALKPSRRVDNS